MSPLGSASWFVFYTFCKGLWAQMLRVWFSTGNNNCKFIGQMSKVSTCVYTPCFLSTSTVKCHWARESVEIWAERPEYSAVSAQNQWSSRFVTQLWSNCNTTISIRAHLFRPTIALTVYSSSSLLQLVIPCSTIEVDSPDMQVCSSCLLWNMIGRLKQYLPVSNTYKHFTELWVSL